KPALGYSSDPFDPGSDAAVVRGLGSNDAGGAVVTMIESFLYLCSEEQKLEEEGLPFNLVLLLSAQEENSGADGIALALKHAPKIDAAIVGEPTQMKGAIGERGLIVLDCTTRGVSGHAAHPGGVNALYKAVEEIDKIRNFHFHNISPTMGEIKMSVTQIEAGRAHNVIPESCSFVVDIRTTDILSNQEVVDLLSSHLECEIVPRNMKNRSSSTPVGSPLLVALRDANIESYISPTTSDWMRIEAPAIKMGPGDSTRSHAPDEYITVEELQQGIEGYINFIKRLKL
ncbi:MAG: M20/M25/M40 family metallo-hydrolase, partial [Bacteroidales bacterium]